MLTITTTKFEATAGVPVLLALAARDAVGAVNWELTDVPHAIPAGMQFTTQGVVGAPATTGEFRFRVSAFDQASPFPQSTTELITVRILEPEIAEPAATAAPAPATVAAKPTAAPAPTPPAPAPAIAPVAPPTTV